MREWWPVAGDKLEGYCNNSIRKNRSVWSRVINVEIDAFWPLMHIVHPLTERMHLGPHLTPKMKETSSFPLSLVLSLSCSSPSSFPPFFHFFIFIYILSQCLLCARLWAWGREWIKGNARRSSLVK